MNLEQGLVLVVLVGLLAMFLWGRWRYDVVAVAGLLLLGAVGVIPPEELFSGFSSPAVITVGAVLVVSAALGRSGVVDFLARSALQLAGASTTGQVFALVLLGLVCSSFMNNVGALALLLPVALRISETTGISRSKLLMPLAFASLLGGMTTLIGTPPNIIVSGFRQASLGEPYRLFDYTPVGLAIVGLGLLYLPTVGWRLIPERRSENMSERFELGHYVTEFLLAEGSALEDRKVAALAELGLPEIVVLSVVRGGHRTAMPSPEMKLEVGDRLLIEVDPRHVDEFVEQTRLELYPAENDSTDKEDGNSGSRHKIEAEDVALVEALVLPASRLVGTSARASNLRNLHRVSLIGVARRGAFVRGSVGDLVLRPLDLILLQCARKRLSPTLSELGLLSLAQHESLRSSKRQLLLTTVIFAAAIVVVAMGWWSAAMAFATAAIVIVLSGLLPTQEIYKSIDASVIVLLAALIPVGRAFESTGAAATLADFMIGLVGGLAPVWVLGTLMLVTMMLSDIMNNAATAVVMAPIALEISKTLGLAADPFLMAVAIGASSAFLTPVGHQSNLLVVNPGGYRFSDFWRPGLLLELMIVAVTCPLLLRIWG